MLELGDERGRFLERLRQIALERGDDGALAIPDEQIEDLLALLLLSALAAGGSAELSAAEGRTLVAFGLRAGLQGGESDEQTQRIILRHLDEQPLDPKLLGALETTARGLAGEGGEPIAGHLLQRFLGQRRRAREALEQGERPADTVPAGPGARFELQAPEKKPKKRGGR